MTVAQLIVWLQTQPPDRLVLAPYMDPLMEEYAPADPCLIRVKPGPRVVRAPWMRSDQEGAVMAVVLQ